MGIDENLADLVGELSEEEIAQAVQDLPPALVHKLAAQAGSSTTKKARTPIRLAQQLDKKFAVRKHLIYLSNRLAHAVRDVEAGKSRRVIISLPPRAGKLVADSTPVLTTEGWTTHGQLKPGDFVFSPSGKPVKVLAVSEPDQASLEVTFTDGESIKVHPNHEWKLYCREIKDWRVRETKYLTTVKLWTGERGKRGGRVMFQLPGVSPLQFPAGVPVGKALPRKTKVSGGFSRRVGISDVTPCEPETGRCIQVDAADGLYLVGRSLKPTHNSTLISLYTPLWILSRHPDWNTVMASNEATLSTHWGRTMLRLVQDNPQLGIQVGAKAAASEWETTAGARVLSRGVNGSLTGSGAKCLFIDDPHKSYQDSHSPAAQRALWDWYLSVASTRLEHPYLLCVIGTRWAEADFIGRLRSPDTEGDPDEWEVITIPAIAREGDPLGRAPGDPLMSPLSEDTREQALERWNRIRSQVGGYVWEAMYQQDPTPVADGIFKPGWFQYWTSDPEVARRNPDVVLLSAEQLTRGDWADSWDCAFKGSETSDWVVGQRWVRTVDGRYVLVAQQRGKWDFNATLSAFRRWSGSGDAHNAISPYGDWVRRSLVEDAANGPAIVSSLKNENRQLVPIRARDSKEGRARAVSPLIEDARVLLPFPGEAPWVGELIDEAVAFPHGKHDDQVDSMTQALNWLREHGSSPGSGRIGIPTGRMPVRAGFGRATTGR